MSIHLLEDAPCGFVSFGDDARIRSVNLRLLELVGRTRDELIGERIDILFGPGGRVFYHTHLFPMLKLHRRIDEMYLSLQSRGGEQMPVLLNAVRRVVDGETVNECILVVVRQRSRFEDEILRAKRIAEDAVREKTIAIERLEQAKNELQVQQEQLEMQQVELEAQQAELEIQQDELLNINQQLETDITERLRIEAELRIRVRHESTLNRIGDTIRSSTIPADVHRSATQALGEALGVDRCYFIHCDKLRDSAEVVAEWRSPETRYAANRGGDIIALNWRNIREAETPLVVTDAGDLYLTGSAKSGLAIGLFEAGEISAAICVEMFTQPRHWTLDEIALVQGVATQVRTALDAARLHERERNIANRLQAALLPEIDTRLPGLSMYAYYRPALDEAKIGGDFYDVYPVEHGLYAVVVADLSGKGLQAAAQIATVRHMLRAIVYRRFDSLAGAIEELNDLIAGHNLLEGFATLFVGLYRPDDRTLEYVCCGQEPALLRRAASGHIDLLKPTGPILGSITGASFGSSIAQMQTGDVLAIFTDGLTEAGAKRSEMLGVEGLCEFFGNAARQSGTPERVAQSIIDSVVAAVTPRGIRDDICLLVMRSE